MLKPEQVDVVTTAIDERVVALEQTIEECQAEIANLEAAKDELNQKPASPIINPA